MAKKKEETKEIAPEDSVARLRAEITKEFGEGVFKSGQDIIDKQIKILSWSPSLDRGLSGGVPTGTWISMSGPEKHGKAQPLYSMVFTPTGPVEMGNLKIGDSVCCPDGSISKIVNIFEQGYKDVYRVYFNDKTFTDCCEEHLWKVKSVDWKEYKILSTKNLMKTNLYTIDAKNRKRWKYNIELCKYAEFNKQNLVLDPYLLGLLLGDGGFTNKYVITFTNSETDIINRFNEIAKHYGCVLTAKHKNIDSGIDYTVTSNKQKNYINRVINKLGLRGLDSKNKFIPKQYLYSSYDQRVELVRGLMDTDGTVSKKGTSAYYYTSSIQLAKDFQYLFNSIGGICTISKKYTKCNGKEFVSYTCNLRFENIPILFKSNKKTKLAKKLKKKVTRKIVKIEKIGNEICRCIEIEHPNHLYLTDNFIVTHNTISLLCLAAEAQRQGMPVVFLNVEGRLKKMNLVCVNGLDPSPNKFIVIESTLTKTLSSQDYLRIAEKWLKTCPCFIIIDSISSLADEKELEGGLGTMTRGHNNVVIAQFILLVAQLVGPSGSIVAGIVQDYANVTGYGAATREKAASKWKYQADIAIRIKKFDHWTTGSGDNERNIGQILNIEIKTSALGNPYNKVLTYHRYGKGIDKTFELVNQAESIGLIDKGGAGWYTLSYLKTDDTEAPKVQGGENVLDYLNNNQDALDKLKQKLIEAVT